MAEHNAIGQQGEKMALSHLKEKGYKILACNWRFQKAELDIIARYDQSLVIVEVKTRTSTEFESPKEAVSIAKQRRIIKAANAYIEEHNLDLECRFDIVSIVLGSNKADIEHIQDAFYPTL